MNEKKILNIVVFSFLFVFAVTIAGNVIRLDKSERALEQVRTELSRATERERELTIQLERVDKQLDAALETIRDSQKRVDEIRTITEKSAKRFEYGFTELRSLRSAIAEAEEYYKNLEVQLDLLRNGLSNDNSDLEVK